jgi:lysine 2,3-aminomutase
LGRTTGYAIPQFVVDTSGGGKVPLLPNYTLKQSGDYVDLQGFNGTVTHYPVLK